MNHDDGCPEHVASNVARTVEPEPLSCPPPASMPPVGLDAVTQERPQRHPDYAASPEDVRDTVLEQQVKDADEPGVAGQDRRGSERSAGMRAAGS